VLLVNLRPDINLVKGRIYDVSLHESCIIGC